VFGINPFAAYLACRQRLRVPVWADLNGYVPAEGQTHCRLYGSDEHLEHFWRMEMQAARRADRISTATRRQRLATLGELAIAGRLNRHNAEYLDFVTWIPEAVAERYANFQAPPPFMRGKSVGVPRRRIYSFVVRRIHTWTDVDTMHGALERVMAAHPNFHFAATGGQSPDTTRKPSSDSAPWPPPRPSAAPITCSDGSSQKRLMLCMANPIWASASMP
jgi:hypothetical protein